MTRTAIALMLLPAILASALLATKSERHETQKLAAETYLFAPQKRHANRDFKLIGNARPDDARRESAAGAPGRTAPKPEIAAVGAAILYGLEWSRR